MSAVRTLIALALAGCLAAPATAAVVGGTGKGHKNVVHGKVVSVQMDANKGTGTVTILVQHHKKNSTGAAPVEKTFKLSASTKFELVQGKKGSVQQSSSDVSAVQKGEQVLIFHNGGDATDVKIVRKKKAKKTV
jgi:hypothetical protein